MTRRFKKGTAVQSFLFDQGKWTVAAAKKWLSSYGDKVPTVESSGDYHRFRQRPPFQFMKGTFRTIPIGKVGEGIKAVIAVPRTREKQNPKPSSSRTEKKNPAKSSARKSRIPALMVDLADALAIELEDGRELKFPIRGGFALCTTKTGDELWILSRKKGKRVEADDEKAEQLFEKFTGFEADYSGALVQLPALMLERIGRAMSIIYRSDKFAKKPSDYIHAFASYPTVSADNATRPKIIALRGGKLRVTAEGITG